MLRELHIAEFALIDDLSIVFEPGFNVISGETGAGKSLLAQALDLILGGKASADVVRKGATEAMLEAHFEVTPAMAKPLSALLDQTITDELLIRRTIHAEGRSRNTVNQRLTALATLREAGRFLFEIQSQRDQLILLRPEMQLRALDRFGGVENRQYEFAAMLDETRALIDQHNTAKNNAGALRDKADFIRFQISELESLGLKPGDGAELERRKRLLDHQEEIQLTLGESYQRIYESDHAVLGQIHSLAARMERLTNSVPELLPVISRIQQAEDALADAASAIRDFLGDAEFDSGEKLQLDERYHALKSLETKYHKNADELVEHLRMLRAELNALAGGDNNLQAMQTKIAEQTQALVTMGRSLNRARAKISRDLCAALTNELKDLGMEKVCIEFRIENSDTTDIAAMSRMGLGLGRFWIAPNPGEDFHTLEGIASGGELSRIMLALQAILAQTLATPTLLFDEIDSHIGQRMGVAVAKKMQAMAQTTQVICITHLPHIACHASHHLKVGKDTRAGRTITSVKTLQGDARVREIAEMLHGPVSTKKAIQNAREMLQHAAGDTA